MFNEKTNLKLNEGQSRADDRPSPLIEGQPVFKAFLELVFAINPILQLLRGQ